MKFQSLLFTMLVAVLGFAQVPTITGLSSLSGNSGGTVTISGSGFSATASNNIVYFGSIKAPCISSTTTSMTVAIPTSASNGKVSYTNLASTGGPKSCISEYQFSTTFPGSAGFNVNTDFVEVTQTIVPVSTTVDATSSFGLIPSPILNHADFNVDGKIDLIIATGTGNTSAYGATIYRNASTGNGDFTFSTPTSLSASSSIESVGTADINSDGKFDVILGSPTVATNSLIVYPNTSSTATISFGTAVIIDAPNVNFIKFSDINKDGKIDILFKTTANDKIYACLNSTTNINTPTFATPSVLITTSNIGFEVGDIDNDGDDDIMVATSGARPKYHINSGSGTFSSTATFTTASGNTFGTYGPYVGNANLVDLDGDGSIDFAGRTDVNSFSRNTTSGGTISFENVAGVTCDGCGFRSTATIDIDGDGDVDLVGGAPYTPPRMQINRNTTTGSTLSFAGYNELWLNSTGKTMTGCAVDLDNNGRPEFIQINGPSTTSSTLSIVRNKVGETLAISTHPSTTAQTYCQGVAATALTIVASGSSPTYQWEQSANGSTGWANVSSGTGATSTTYTPSTAAAGTLYYRCKVTDASGSIWSNASGAHTVNALPTLTTNPNTTLSQYCYSNPNTAYGITVATSASSPTYQWQQSTTAGGTFTNVSTGSGGTSATFYPSHVDVWYGGTKYYRCIVTSNGCSTTSNTKPYGVYADLTWTNPSNAAQNICINGTSTALSMTATGPNVVYSWQKSPNGSSSWTSISGANTNTYTPPTNIAGVNYYRCYISGTCSNTATASSGAITVTDTYTWTGATSTDPTVASNWSPAAVPCSGANEVIPTGLTNYPAYTNLTIDAGTTLTVQSGGRLTVTGTLTNNGTLTIESGATFLQGSSLAGTGTYNVKQNVTGAGGATPTGRFWYMGLPINNLTRATAFGTASGSNRLWSWSESSQAWSSQITDATTLTPTTGYVFRTGADVTLNFSGTSLYSADANITGLTNTTGSFDGCHLMSNPYTAYLDWEAVIAAAGTTNLASTYCVRSYNTGSSTMVYDTYNATGDVAVNPSGVAMTRYIAPMQSFWITVNPSSTGTLSMTKAMLSHQPTGVGLKDITSFPAFARLNLVSGNFYDQVVVYTDVNATAEFDDYDSKKFFLPNVPQVYCPVGDKKTVINALKQGKAQTSAPLTVELPSTQVYKFEMAESFVENGLVILEDKQEGIFQDMGVNPIYEFFGNSGVIADRFVLHFQLPNGTNNEGQAGVEDLTSGQIAVIANHDGAITVALSADLTTSGDIQIFDEAGRLVAQKAITSAQTNLQLNNGMGVYFVRVQTPMKTEMKKVMVY